MNFDKRYLVFLLSLFVFMLCFGNAQAMNPNKRQSIVVKLNSFDAANWEDPVAGGHNWQSVCMAMGITDHMLGRRLGPRYVNEVTLFLNLEAVELADIADVPDLSIFTCSSGKNLQQCWDDLVGKGVSIMVCPGCAVIGGITPDIVREGAHMGNMPSVQQLFLRADKVIDF